MKIQFGISTWLYQDYPLEAAVEKTGKAGFKLLELWGNTHCNPESFTAVQAEYIRKNLQRLDMRVFSLHAPFKLDLADQKEAARRQAAQMVAESIKLAAVFKPRIVVLHPGNYKGAQCRADMDSYCRSLRESIRFIAGTAAKYSCRLAIENMVHVQPWNKNIYQFGWSIPQLRALTRDFPGAGICLDLGHAFINRAPYISPAGDRRVLSCHIHDNDGRGDSHLVPGKGRLNLLNFFAAVRGRRTRPELVFEIAGGDNPDEILSVLISGCFFGLRA